MTCKLCGILLNGSHQNAHNQVHHADYEPFAAAKRVTQSLARNPPSPSRSPLRVTRSTSELLLSPGAAETCKLCGILINRSYWDTHNRGHR